MPQPKKGPRLGANPSHQRLMLRSLARSLFEHERIKTTESKAKLLSPYADSLITKAKKGTIHHRRQVLSDIEDRAVVHKLFADIAPRFEDRNGGYTRVLKMGPRAGDGAEMALIELVEEAATGATTTEDTAEGTARRRRLRRSRRRDTGGELPQDKPVRSRGEAAAAAADPLPGTRELPDEDVEDEAETDDTDADAANEADESGSGGKP